jgi:hypothetical protein
MSSGARKSRKNRNDHKESVGSPFSCCEGATKRGQEERELLLAYRKYECMETLPL